MPRYLFVFGRNPVLSLAELVSVLKNEEPSATVVPHWKNGAEVSSSSLNVARLAQKLGGTTKIARVQSEFSAVEKTAVQPELDKARFFPKLSDKFYFAVSPMGKVSDQNEESFLAILKEGFKAHQMKAIFKRTNAHKAYNVGITTPSEIISWKLLETGTDWVLARTADGYLLAETVAISNPKEWRDRDKNRPKKENKELLSIRLAKILINLAGLKEKQTLLDPFCGYGTVLQEALLNGLHAIGSEKENQKVQAAAKNLRWLVHQRPLSTTFQVLQHDAATLSAVLKQGAVQGVVTEPDLGPYYTKKPPYLQAKQTIESLQALYGSTFQELSKILVAGARVVIIFPVFQYTDQKLRVSESIFSPWFRSINPLEGLNAPYDKTFPVFYQNPSNKLGREIWVLERKA